LHVARRRRRVALVAELRHLLVAQEMAVRTAVRLVAGLTPLDGEAEVLEDERTLHLSVAAERRPPPALAKQRPPAETAPLGARSRVPCGWWQSMHETTPSGTL